MDNWGIFLLARLQSYFQKKEKCDLTLRFPHANSQIKAHSLVVDACTEYFADKVVDGGGVDMPEDLLPEAVAPIIR